MARQSRVSGAGAFLLELPPAAGAVVGDDRPEDGREGSSVDGFALPDRDHPPGLVAVAAGDDALGVGRQATVVQEDRDVILRREQRCDVAVEDEVGLDGPLDRFDDFGVGAMDEIPAWWQIACCQSGRASIYASTRGSVPYVASALSLLQVAYCHWTASASRTHRPDPRQAG